MKTVMRTLLRVAFVASTTLSGAAFAGEVKVPPNDTDWRNLPGELRDNATAGITGTAPRSGGSLELTGPRTRFAIGNIYPNAATTPLIALNQVTGLTFDWRIAGDSDNPYNPDYTPALRLHIWDAGAGVRREIIWEGAYNGRHGPQTVPDTWYRRR